MFPPLLSTVWLPQRLVWRKIWEEVIGSLKTWMLSEYTKCHGFALLQKVSMWQFQNFLPSSLFTLWYKVVRQQNPDFTVETASKWKHKLSRTDISTKVITNQSEILTLTNCYSTESNYKPISNLYFDHQLFHIN